MQPMKPKMTLSVANGRTSQITVIANITCTTHAGNKLQTIRLVNVHMQPSIHQSNAESCFANELCN